VESARSNFLLVEPGSCGTAVARDKDIPFSGVTVKASFLWAISAFALIWCEKSLTATVGSMDCISCSLF